MSACEVVIVGAGLGGLIVGHRLRRAGVDVALLDAADRPGGVIRSRDWGGAIVESGPNSFRIGDELTALLAELDLAEAVIDIDPRGRRRYVVRDGRLLPLPRTPSGLLGSRLLGPLARARVLLEPWLHGVPPAGEESVQGFAERHLGAEASRFLAAPYVGGVWAGDPERLSLRAAFPAVARLVEEHGSLLRAAARGAGDGDRRRQALRGGNRVLPLALARELGDALELGWAVASIRRGAHGWIARRDDGDERVAPSVVLALPPVAAARAVREAEPALGEALASFEHAPLAVVHSRVHEAALARELDGFGHLVPRGEGFRHLGTIWTSSIFPDRVASGEALLTTFIGGALDPDAAELDDAQACELVDGEHRRLGLYAGSPAAIARDPGTKWIAQYTVGHGERLDRAEQLAAKAGGLYLAGSGYHGVAVSDCVREAEALARRILDEAR